jgi:hypothetical protein
VWLWKIPISIPTLGVTIGSASVEELVTNFDIQSHNPSASNSDIQSQNP